MRARLPGAAGVLATLLLAGCVTPALDHGAFAQNGTAAVESTISATATAQLAVQERLADRATLPFADVVVTESEQAIAPVEASFGGVDPPSPADDALRDAVLKAVGDAGDALSSARIAVRRDDTPGMLAALQDLATAQTHLRALAEALGAQP